LPTKIQRLQSFIDPVKAQWQTPEAQNSVANFSSFCELIGLDKAQQYLTSHSVHRISDWGTCELDAEGLALQADLEERLKVRVDSLVLRLFAVNTRPLQRLPLRTTKSFLSFSVERIDRSSPAFEASTALWQDSLTSILPLLLQFLRFVVTLASTNTTLTASFLHILSK
jgi:exportin-5